MFADDYVCGFKEAIGNDNRREESGLSATRLETEYGQVHSPNETTRCRTYALTG